jgi:hypothetical protein
MDRDPRIKHPEDLKFPRTYMVTKVFDKELNRACFETRMCGQDAYVYVPTKQFQKLRKKGKEALSKWLETVPYDKQFKALWKPQKIIDPIIGQPVYFSSTRLGAGWWRSAEVVSCNPSWNGHKVVLETTTGVYYLTADTEGEG